MSILQIFPHQMHHSIQLICKWMKEVLKMNRSVFVISSDFGGCGASVQLVKLFCVNYDHICCDSWTSTTIKCRHNLNSLPNQSMHKEKWCPMAKRFEQQLTTNEQWKPRESSWIIDFIHSYYSRIIYHLLMGKRRAKKAIWHKRHSGGWTTKQNKRNALPIEWREYENTRFFLYT